MAMTTSLILIILQLAGGLAIGLTFYLLKKSSHVGNKPAFSRRLFDSRSFQVLLVLYPFLLLVALGAYYLLPVDRTMPDDKITDRAVLYAQFEQMVKTHDSEVYQAPLFSQTEDFDFTGTQLEIPGFTPNAPQIIQVDRNGAPTGRLSVTQYYGGASFNDIDLTAMTQASVFRHYTLQNHTLVDTTETDESSLERQHLQIKAFTTPALLLQFEAASDLARQAVLWGENRWISAGNYALVITVDPGVVVLYDGNIIGESADDAD